MGTLRETLTKETKGALHLGSKRSRVYSDLTSEEKDRYNADIRATNILLYHYIDAKDIWDNVKMLPEGSELTKEDRESQLFVTAVKLNRGLRDSNYDQLYAYLKQHEGAGAAGYGGAQNRVGYANPGQARQIKCYNCNSIGHIARNCTQPKRPQNSEYFKDKKLLMQAQDNRVTLDEWQLLFIVDGQDNVVDDDAPNAQTMFRANLSSANPIYDEAGPSYDSDVLSEVHDHYHYQDVICKHHEVHEMHDDVQLNYVVDSHTGYTSDSNMIPYDQNNREVHLDCLKHLKESVATLHEIVEEAKYQHRNKQNKAVPVGIPTPTDAAMQSTVTYANQLDSNHNWGSNFPNSPSLSVFKCRSYRPSFVRFENDHFGAIMGYGDYVIGDSVISRVYYVEGLGHNLFFVRQFCDSDLEVAFRKHPCYVHNTNGVEIIKDLGKLQTTVDIGIFVGYAPSRKGYRIYNKRTQRIMENIHVQFDELSEPMAPMQLSTGPASSFLMPGQISLGLVPNLVPAAPYVLPTNKDLEILFQPMFDEYLEPPRVDRQVSPAPAVPVHVNLAGTPSSTAIDQDAHSPSHSPSSLTLQSLCLHQVVAAESTLMDENLFAPVDKDPFINIVASDPTSAESS
nr:integrase, catalytic region, zinc finger, CCHC-type, peptidase aspartic, catalytic [Tanacetum cinerariifolium]